MPESRFIKKQKILKDAGPRDVSKSNATRRSWRQHRNANRAGLQKFARSIEGRKLHRKLGRFNATRLTSTKPELGSAAVSLRKEVQQSLGLD